MCIDEGHAFSKTELERILTDAMGKRVAEVDVKDVLGSGLRNKGYVGAVVEQSLLGYPADNKRRPDLLVDGVPVELKTTGIRRSKSAGGGYEAKEPVSVTAVKPEEIVHEEFDTSAFWEKCAHLLFVYYLYSHKVSSPAEFGDFLIKGFEFIDFDDEDKALLERDWTIVRDFIRKIQREYPQNPESQYPRISSELNRQELSVLDTAPKWPNPPRFRLKRQFVTLIAEKYFGGKFDQLPMRYSSLNDLERECQRLTRSYSGKTVHELCVELGIERTTVSKRDAEMVVVRMFGGAAKKMRNVEIFNKFSVVGHTFVMTKDGRKTEDMKLFPIDFDEVGDESVTFEESAFRANFADSSLLVIMFEEPGAGKPFSENVFKGFELLAFSDAFIEREVRSVFEKCRSLIVNHELRLEPRLCKDGTQRINKNGQPSEAPNWPKSKDGIVFVRGTGANSEPEHKPLVVNGLHMYPQNLWIRGAFIAEKLKDLSVYQELSRRRREL